MLTIAIVLLVFVGLYVVIGSIRNKKLMINKSVVILTVVAVGLIFVQGYFNKGDSKSVEAPYYQQIAPPASYAPYLLSTPSRAFFVASYKDTDTHLVLNAFYYYDKKKWEYSEIPLTLDKSLPEYSNLKVIKRGG